MATKAGRSAQKAVSKVVADARMYVPAGQAAPSPPLGPALGQVTPYVVFKQCDNVL